MAKSDSGSEMPNGWQAWFFKNSDAGWSFEMRHRSGDQVGGNQRSEDMARKIAGIIADTTHVEPPKPADPAWMVEAATAADMIVSAKAPDMFEAAMCALRLALERGHVVEPLRWTEEALVEAAREDAAQANEGRGNLSVARQIRRGEMDGGMSVTVALQARRNMLREMDPDFREAAEPVKIDLSGARAALSDVEGLHAAERARQLGVDMAKPGSERTAVSALRRDGKAAIFYVEGEARRVDLEAALKRAWDDGATFVRSVVQRRVATMGPNLGSSITRDNDVSSILSTLPAKE